jgi:hypothetical protein
LLLLLRLELRPLKGLLLGLRLLDILRPALRGGLSEAEEVDGDLPRLAGGGARPLRGESDLEGDRTGLLTGDRVRPRIGDLLGGILATRLGGVRRLGGRGLRAGLPRTLLGEALIGDLGRRGGDGERPLPGEVGLLFGGVTPRRKGDSGRRRIGESARRRGGEPSGLLGDPPLRGPGDLLLGGGDGSFSLGEDSLC